MSSTAKRVAITIVVSLLLLSEGGLAENGSASWAFLSASERAALAPVESQWSAMPAYQRERLVLLAHRYWNLSPSQQRRISDRLVIWTQLTRDERDLIRLRYRRLLQLEPAQKRAVEQALL